MTHKVSKTIEHLIEQLFQKIENSLIYICSDDNEKGEKSMKSSIDGIKNLNTKKL